MAGLSEGIVEHNVTSSTNIWEDVFPLSKNRKAVLPSQF